MSTSKLTPDRWIAAGFDALQMRGPTALAAEPLARQLGTTKGSFYWHFKDVPAYHDALLRQWQAEALAEVLDLLRSDGSADQRLRQFGRTILSDPSETALRLWSRTTPQVAATLAEVDAERLTYLTHLLRQLGLRNPAFARALLASLIGLPQLSNDEDAEAAFGALVDTVLALS
ncbi:TetR/AcrR family transcriptional regulator [Sulfitobacter sp. SK012]|uniref:TetR/AcrR family transcriptional regulator n=1 Tax=Sulfitobacter sp. SK012 TaxID=1389005 RepID=UPI000E0B9064|nr:TetR/AcrR family transcriptional regulator [Sulfitobacter sp. SK012]AXI45069.1 TetR/AcrR family transcriptional regulator [Sulfitobacter sp. SK012]